MSKITTDGTRYGWECSRCINGNGAMVHIKAVHANSATAEWFAAIHDSMYHAGMPGSIKSPTFPQY